MRFAFALLITLVLVVFSIFVSEAFADRGHWYPTVTEQVNLTEVVNEYNNYTADTCQGVAEAQAAANNNLYMGTKAFQLSPAAGTCGEAWATSLMAGVRINDRIMVNGSWSHNFNTGVDAAGFGALILLK